MRDPVGAVRWRGRRGVVLLGPTEDRVGRYLVERTKYGRVAIRTVELAERLGLERSEAYRITARLRVLGLFGVRNDQGGTLGGRWYWRTAVVREAAGLDPARHRRAWSRVLSAARARAARVAALIRRGGVATTTPTRPPVIPRPAAASFRDAFIAAGGGPLLDAWEGRRHAAQPR
jgi:hypothetical protein